jgi:hypothetical protein
MVGCFHKPGLGIGVILSVIMGWSAGILTSLSCSRVFSGNKGKSSCNRTKRISTTRVLVSTKRTCSRIIFLGFLCNSLSRRLADIPSPVILFGRFLSLRSTELFLVFLLNSTKLDFCIYLKFTE